MIEMADGYHTHLPFLVTSLCQTFGDVLEMGAGFYSTPVLSDFCGSQGRQLYTYERVGPHADALKGMNDRPHHTFTIVDGYEKVSYLRPWGLAFLDHTPAPSRLRALLDLKPYARVIVVHGADGPEMIKAVEGFKHHVWCKHLKPWKTAIVSETVDVTKWPLVAPEVPIVGPVVEANTLSVPAMGDPEPDFVDQFDARERRLPPPPQAKRSSNLVMYTVQGHSISLENHFRGSTAFLLLSGPSSKELDLSRLEQRGFLTMCVNNSWSLIKPKLWTAVDDPQQFLDTGWKDPTIMKFVPHGKLRSRLGTKRNGVLRHSSFSVNQMPNTFFYPRNEKFQVETFLHEDSVNWGNHAKVTDKLGCRGSRSVMLAATRILYYLGVRRLFLVGCDFLMTETLHYAFPQDRERGAVKGNNNTYKDLNIRFKALRPLMEAQGLQVFNTNPKSGLTAFDHVPYDTACKEVEARYCVPAALDTAGWYTFKQKGPTK